MRYGYQPTTTILIGHSGQHPQRLENQARAQRRHCQPGPDCLDGRADGSQQGLQQCLPGPHQGKRPDTLRSKRAEATQAYYTLKDFINGFHTINKGKEPFKKVADELTALIEAYTKLVNKRGKVVEPEVVETP